MRFIVSLARFRPSGDHIEYQSTELVFRASNELEQFGKLSYKTLQTAEHQQQLDGNPLYAILHESIYCQGYGYSDRLSYNLVCLTLRVLQQILRLVCSP